MKHTLKLYGIFILIFASCVVAKLLFPILDIPPMIAGAALMIALTALYKEEPQS